jgi:glycosyltransferase involved in cell wall biosynthesis
MKLAYFSPLPPQKSGISDYSEALLPYLSKHYDIHLWVSGFRPDSSIAYIYKVINYQASQSTIYQLDTYDAILYNIGNNPEYHSDMYDVFLRYPGFVILHDYVLFYLITGYFLDTKGDREKYIREFYLNYGYDGISEVKKILRGEVPPLQYRNPEKFPLINSLVQAAKGIIVHSESTKRILLDNGCPSSKIDLVNQINYSNLNFAFGTDEISKTKKKFEIRDGTLLLCSFGYIAPTKRNEQVITVINRIAADYDIQYVMVGEGNYIDGLLASNIKKTGFVSRDIYERLLSASDIVINLRNPSMGETSATLLQAMIAGKPCIVTDIGWFSELPDNAVLKIPADKVNEQPQLEKNLRLLIEDPEKRKELGNNARAYVTKNHDPTIIAEQIFHVLQNGSFQRDLINSYPDCNLYRIKEIFVDDTDPLFKKYQQKIVALQHEIGLREDISTNIFQALKNFITHGILREK